MKKSEVLDPYNLFSNLALDLDSSLVSDTGNILDIARFSREEVDLGIEFTTEQLLPLKISYGFDLTEEERSILDYWRTANKTTIKEYVQKPTQKLIIESGRRCLTEDTRIQTSPYDYLTFKDLSKSYFGDNKVLTEVDINLDIYRFDSYTKATKLYRYQTNELISLVTKETHITGTPDHRLYVEDKGWIKLKNINIDDKLILNSQSPTVVYDKKIKAPKVPVYVYDLHVPDEHWYIANNLKTHNSGKSSLAAIAGAYEFYFLSKLAEPQKYYKVATSTPITILCLATTAEQAKTNIFRQIAQIMRKSSYFLSLEKQGKIFIGKKEISYEEKGIYIQCGNSKSSSQVGATLKCFILDEVSRFEDSNGESNAIELWRNIGLSAAPFKEHAKLIAISSAWYEGDAIQQLYEETIGDSSSIGFKFCSWDINTNISKDNPIVASDYLNDPVKAALEYEGVRPATKFAFFDPYQIQRSIWGNSTISPISYIESYNNVNLVKLKIDKIDKRTKQDTILHIDPSVKSDRYALAYGHSEFNNNNELIVVIDGICVWQPNLNEEVSISNVGEIIKEINKVRPLVKVTADHYNSTETIQRLRQEGIKAEIVYFSNKQQIMMYSRVRTLLAEDRLILPKNSEWSSLIYKELSQIQFINNGKVARIDHPPSGSKDIADAIASVAYQLSERVLADNSKIILPNSPSFNNYDSLNNKNKVMSRLPSRRSWYLTELNNFKSQHPR